jgi:hypothetical protein
MPPRWGRPHHQGREALPDIDVFGCLRSPRARSALMGSAGCRGATVRYLRRGDVSNPREAPDRDGAVAVGWKAVIGGSATRIAPSRPATSEKRKRASRPRWRSATLRDTQPINHGQARRPPRSDGLKSELKASPRGRNGALIRDLREVESAPGSRQLGKLGSDWRG